MSTSMSISFHFAGIHTEQRRIKETIAHNDEKREMIQTHTQTHIHTHTHTHTHRERERERER